MEYFIINLSSNTNLLFALDECFEDNGFKIHLSFRFHSLEEFCCEYFFVYDRYFLYSVLRISKKFYPEQEPNLLLVTKKQV